MAPEVVDISSDEEDVPVGNDVPHDSLGWLSDLSDVGDDATGGGFIDPMIMNELQLPPPAPAPAPQKKNTPDDLVILSEQSWQPVQQEKAKPDNHVTMSEQSSHLMLHRNANPEDFVKTTSLPVLQTETNLVGGHDDDECIILEGDPDKLVTLAEGEGSAGEGSSDNLLIVAEKGPLACRDFPHSRHLCSNLPFSTTPHEMYCNKCHCFVCDTPAPCKYWGNGAYGCHHCHATDKADWPILRGAFKRIRSASSPEKHQDVMYSTVTSPSQQVQSTQCQVATQSLMSILSNMDPPSLANPSPLLNEVSQSPQRHAIFGRTGAVSAPRAGESIDSAHIAQNSRSHAIFRRAGAVSTPGTGGETGNAHIAQNTSSYKIRKRDAARSYPVPKTTANQLGSAATPDNSMLHQTLAHVSQPAQVAPRTNAFTGTAQRYPSQRSLIGPIAFQAQDGQPTVYYQVAPNGMNVIGQQLPQHISLTAQRTHSLQQPSIDDYVKSFNDLLARVASDFGVPSYNISAAVLSQHLASNYGIVLSTASQGLGLQHGSVGGIENMTSSHVHDPSSHPTGGNLQSNDPLQTIENMHHLNDQSSVAPNEAHLNDFPIEPIHESLIEAAPDVQISRLESANVPFEFDKLP
ncbi:hypothetical protein ACP70R_003879 [Stipagrostis hirtigluma subsp. patula]